MKKKSHPFPRIIKIPRNAVIKGVSGYSVEEQKPYRLVPRGGEATKHPEPWGGRQ